MLGRQFRSLAVLARQPSQAFSATFRQILRRLGRDSQHWPENLQWQRIPNLESRAAGQPPAVNPRIGTQERLVLEKSEGPGVGAIGISLQLGGSVFRERSKGSKHGFNLVE